MARTKWFNREVFGWAMFDFANQAFTLVILTTMFQLYFVQHVVPGDEVRGRQLWATSGIIALAVVVLVSPLIGALADFSGAKKRLLLTTYIACVALTGALALVPPGAVAFGMVVFIVGYIFYAIGENFMASFLPELASPRNMGKVSAFGWTLGYVGGLTCLSGAAVITWLAGANEVLGYRLICLWAAVFFLVSALPTFLLVRERKQREQMPPGQTMATVGFHRIGMTFGAIREYGQLFKFLAIMTFYLGGMQIVIWFAGSIATKLFDIPETQLPLFLLVLTVMAIVGAVLTGRFQDTIGTKLTIILALVLWLFVMLGAAFVPEPGPDDPTPSRVMFWLLGSGVGFGMGMLGTSSRAMVGVFSPPHKSAEFFGFYGLGAKIAAILGLAFSILAEELFSGRYNYAVASSGVFFIGGLVMMLTVDERRGRIAAARAARAHVRAHHDFAGRLPVDEANAADEPATDASPADDVVNAPTVIRRRPGASKPAESPARGDPPQPPDDPRA